MAFRYFSGHIKYGVGITVRKAIQRRGACDAVMVRTSKTWDDAIPHFILDDCETYGVHHDTWYRHNIGVLEIDKSTSWIKLRRGVTVIIRLNAPEYGPWFHLRSG